MMNTNNPALSAIGGNMPQDQVNPVIQQIMQISQQYRNPWQEVWKYIRPEQLSQQQLDQFQAMANQLRPLYNQMMGRR